TRAYVWTPSGGLQILPGLGENPTMARSINDNGEIVGTSTLNGATHAVKWVNGVVHDLHPPGADASFANAIGNSRHIVGGEAVGGKSYPLLWRDGQLIELGTAPGTAFLISELGIIGGRHSAGGSFVWTHPLEGPVELPGSSSFSLMDLRGAYALGNGALWH